jgi:hypothetical protein
MSEGRTSSTPQVHTTRSDAVSQHTPHQILGPYFPAIEKPTATSNLTVVDGLDGGPEGEIIEVKGRVLNRKGDAIGGASNFHLASQQFWPLR